MFYYAITTFFGRFGDNYRQNGIYRAAMTVMREEESFLRDFFKKYAVVSLSFHTSRKTTSFFLFSLA